MVGLWRVRVVVGRDARSRPVAFPSVTQTPTATAPASKAVYADRGSSTFDIFLTLMCVVIVLSNVAASKGVKLGPVITDGGFFLFPVAYILGDMITEVYGARAARRAIAMGFAMALLSVVVFAVVIALPGFGDEYGVAKQAALEGALGPVWQIVAASLLGFVAGQASNSAIMVWLKRRTGERGLAARIMGSTGVGELLDTLVFCTVAASAIGITSLGQWANYAFFGFLWKTLVEYACVPLTMAVIKAVKRREPSYQAQLARAS